MPIARSTSIYAGQTQWLLTCAHRHPRAILASHFNLRFVATSPPPQAKRHGNNLSPPSVEIEDRVNPPVSTLPAPISIPPRNKEQSYSSYLWGAGKTYLGFYKTGIKNVLGNRRLAAAVRHRLNSTQTPQLPPSPSDSKQNPQTFAQNLYAKYVLTRAEFQLLRRSSHDMSRVPIFGVLFVILGEWLPVVAVLFTPLLPYTCRIPAQVLSERRVLERRRKRSFRGEIDGNVPVPTVKGGEREVQEIDELSKPQLMHISRTLGRHLRLWDFTRGVLPPAAVLKSKVAWSLAYLDQDDALLLRDGGVEELSDEEVKIACQERGIDVLEKDVMLLRATLRRWVESRHGRTSPLPKLLSRPEGWKDE